MQKIQPSYEVFPVHLAHSVSLVQDLGQESAALATARTTEAENRRTRANFIFYGLIKRRCSKATGESLLYPLRRRRC